MTQEEKQLLLKDLCARLPYGVIVKENDGVNENDNKLLDIDMFDGCINYDYTIDDIKPYLRPISSMTEDEKEYIKNRWCYNDWDIDGPNSLWREKIDVEDADGIIDYFNAHHFDYRGLIEKGLALEAKKEMYKTE